MAEIFNDGYADNAIQKQIEDLTNSAKKEMPFDQLRMYYGEDFWVNDEIVIRQPTIQDFLDLEEKNVYATIAPFTSNPTSYRVQLWDMGIDWNKIQDIELFAMLIKTVDTKYSSNMFKRTLNEFERNKYCEQNGLDINTVNWKDDSLLKPLELNTFDMYNKHIQNEDGEDITVITLYSEFNGLEISQTTYETMAEYIRYLFNSHPEVEKCKGKTLKKQIIQNEKLKQAQAAQEGRTSNMMLLISFALNHPGFKYKKSELRDVGIYEFMDSIQRLQVYESTRALMGGMYSGFVDSKKIPKEDFNFMRELKTKD